VWTHAFVTIDLSKRGYEPRAEVPQRWGVFYIVDPLDDDARQFLKEQGIAVPRGSARGRNPTPAEIRDVCDSLDGFGVEYITSAKSRQWQANIEGLKGRGRNRGTLLNIENWGGSEQRRYQISFENGEPSLILQIVQLLSARCGPFVVVPDSDTPVAVWPEADLKQLLKTWGA
jgi:hypothetical protein